MLQPGLGPLQPNIIEDFELDMFYNNIPSNTFMSSADAENDLISVMVTATTSNMRPGGGQISWPNNPNNFSNMYQQHLNSAGTNSQSPAQLIAQPSPALITQPRVVLQSTYDHAPHSTPLTSPMVLSPSAAAPSGTPMVMPPSAVTQQSQSALISQPSAAQVTTTNGDVSYLNAGNNGGGKQRTNLMARNAAAPPNLPPYPKGHYCYSSSKNSLKANDSHKAVMRSPKHRLLQVCM